MLLPGPPELGGWAFWDKVVYSPDSLDEQDETIKLELAAELLKLPKVVGVQNHHGTGVVHACTCACERCM
jgi:hypothetical protein